MNAKEVYDAVEIRESKTFHGLLVTGEFRFTVDYEIPRQDIDGMSVGYARHFVREKLVAVLYGEIEAILAKYDGMIRRRLSAPGDGENYLDYRLALFDFFNGARDEEGEEENECC
jgi:hypothetical protein